MMIHENDELAVRKTYLGYNLQRLYEEKIREEQLARSMADNIAELVNWVENG